MYWILSLVSLFMFCVHAKEDACKWNDQNGKQFDLNPLKRSKNYQIPDSDTSLGMFGMVYEFNFCTWGVKCKERDVAAFEALEVLGKITENCDTLGTRESQDIQLLNSAYPDLGISVTYGDGDMCFDVKDEDELQNIIDQEDQLSMVPRSITYEIVCSSKNDETFHVIDSTKCNVRLGISHTAGCHLGGSIAGSGTSSSSYLLYLLFTATIYFGVGKTYNQKKNGLEGAAAIPNLDFWKQIPFLVTDGIKFSIQQILLIIRKYSGGGIGQTGTKGYSTV